MEDKKLISQKKSNIIYGIYAIEKWMELNQCPYWILNDIMNNKPFARCIRKDKDFTVQDSILDLSNLASTMMVEGIYKMEIRKSHIDYTIKFESAVVFKEPNYIDQIRDQLIYQTWTATLIELIKTSQPEKPEEFEKISALADQAVIELKNRINNNMF